MTKYIVRRLIMLLPVVVIVGVIVFSLVHLTPGDPVALMLGDEATGDQVERYREELGLNEPFHIQFFIWFTNALRLDFGDSIFFDASVTEVIGTRAQPTILLTIYSLTISLLIGIPLGVVAALKRNSWIDRLSMLIAMSGIAIPNFVLGILMILFFAVVLGWFSSGGYTHVYDDPVDHFKKMIMPSFALGFSSAAFLARLVRSSMLDVLNEDYVRTARAKGLHFYRVVTRHAFRNAMIPAVTVIGYTIGNMLSGSVVVETVFTIPGIGRLTVQSVLRRDYPVIQGTIMLIAVIYVLANLLVDVLYVYIDPRIRYDD